MDDIEVLIATEAIRTLQARYARYADEKNWHELAGLFTHDATFTPRDADGNTLLEMAGRQRIEDSLTAVNAGDVQPIHLLLTAEIDILTPTTAKAIWAMADIIYRNAETASDATGDLPDFKVMRGWGHYHNDYVKTGGEWLISRSVQTRTRLEFE